MGDSNESPVFYLKLERSYYNKGFFNIKVHFDHLVGGDGPVTLVLGDAASIQARIDRKANLNRMPRIMGGTRLRDWFQGNYTEGGTVPVRFEGRRRLALG